MGTPTLTALSLAREVSQPAPSPHRVSLLLARYCCEGGEPLESPFSPSHCTFAVPVATQCEAQALTKIAVRRTHKKGVHPHGRGQSTSPSFLLRAQPMHAAVTLSSLPPSPHTQALHMLQEGWVAEWRRYWSEIQRCGFSSWLYPKLPV